MSSEESIASRILLAAEALSASSHVSVPDVLRTVSGDPQARRMQRFEAIAGFMEALVLENVSPGLSKSLATFSLAELWFTSDSDLQEVLGLSKATVKKLRAVLGNAFQPSAADKAPPLKDIVEELSLSADEDTDG